MCRWRDPWVSTDIIVWVSNRDAVHRAPHRRCGPGGTSDAGGPAAIITGWGKSRRRGMIAGGAAAGAWGVRAPKRAVFCPNRQVLSSGAAQPTSPRPMRKVTPTNPLLVQPADHNRRSHPQSI